MRKLIVPLGISLLLSGCAGAVFPYKYYGLNAENYSGALYGPTVREDLNLMTCAPDDVSRGKCIVILKDEFYRLKNDFLTMRFQLKELQKQWYYK